MKSRFVHKIRCESPFISRGFYAIRPLILWRILGTYFLLIGGVGVVEIAVSCGCQTPRAKNRRCGAVPVVRAAG